MNKVGCWSVDRLESEHERVASISWMFLQNLNYMASLYLNPSVRQTRLVVSPILILKTIGHSSIVVVIIDEFFMRMVTASTLSKRGINIRIQCLIEWILSMHLMGSQKCVVFHQAWILVYPQRSSCIFTVLSLCKIREFILSTRVLAAYFVLWW